MEDKELIELAAKAYVDRCWHDDAAYMQAFLSKWNPLTDDGDALRLAVNLQLEIYIDHIGVSVRTHCGIKALENKCDAEATRRAITRAAAQIGKEME